MIGDRCRASAWRHWSAGLLVAAWLLGGCGGDDARLPGPALIAHCEPDSVAAVGDPIRLRLQASWPDSVSQAVVAWPPLGEGLIVLSRDSSDVPGAGSDHARDYVFTLIAPRAGRGRVPPLALVDAAGDTLARSRGWVLAIHSQVSSPEDDELAPLAPLADLRGFPWRTVGILAVAVLAAGVLAWLWRRRRAARAPAVAPPPIPPAVEFAAAIDALRERRLAERGELRAYAQELSWVFRRYLGRRWDQPALEATRPEIVRWLPDVPLDVGDQVEVADWLTATDRIKFAGERLLLDASQALLERAERLVQRMEAIGRDVAGGPPSGQPGAGAADIAEGGTR